MRSFGGQAPAATLGRASATCTLSFSRTTAMIRNGLSGSGEARGAAAT
jgi:hypothetical protein